MEVHRHSKNGVSPRPGVLDQTFQEKQMLLFHMFIVLSAYYSCETLGGNEMSILQSSDL